MTGDDSRLPTGPLTIIQTFKPFFDNVLLEAGGLQDVLSQYKSFLPPKFESVRLPEPTGDSPDVVHLIKYAY